jgi:hypothetical protein
MSIEDHQFADPFTSLHSCTQPEPSTDAPLPSAAAKSHLSELEGLLQGLVTAPAEQMDIAAVTLVRKAMKARSRLSVLLALRALRLEQGLRQAQRQVIQLQWELAQFRRCVAPLPAAPREVED